MFVDLTDFSTGLLYHDSKQMVPAENYLQAAMSVFETCSGKPLTIV
jgi:hypothetical protein